MSRERSRETELTMPCLGRPFQLGMLYDCRSDQLIPSMTLWSQKKFKQACKSSPQEFSKFEVISDNSIDIKLSKLGVDVNLKLSFLSGLLGNISGAAEYLNDRISSKNQARVSLKYQSTARYDQLAMEKVGELDNPDVLKDTSATHIIIGVVYGADAIFVFDQEVSQDENFGNVHEFMKAMVEKLCTSGNVDLDTNDTDKKKLQKFRCQLHCDVSLPECRTNFEGAVKLYRELPKRLGGKDCPKTAWLYPLSKLDSKVVPITREISGSLVNETQKVMESLHEVEIKSNDLMNSKVCTSFPHIKEQILHFKRKIGEYRADFFKNLAALLPQVRGGDKEEVEMTKLVKINQASPFSERRLSSWVEGKLREVKILDRYLNSLKEIEFAFSPGDVDAFVNDLEYNHIISFTFRIARRSDPYLEEMVIFLEIHKSSQEMTNPTPWYDNPTITKDLKHQARQFKSFAEANKQRKEIKFVVTSSSSSDAHEESDKGAVIELYDDCEKEIFEPPSQPGKPKATTVTHDSIRLKWSEPEYGAHNVQFYTVRYCELSSSTEEWNVMKTVRKEESITINGLDAKKEYSFKVHAECKAGISSVSETSDSIRTDTLPVSPGKPTASNVTHDSILLQWSKPCYGIHNPKFYTIYYYVSKASSNLESQWKEVKVEDTKEFVNITGLAAQTLYSFKVCAEFETGRSLVSDVSNPIETYPEPMPPAKPSASSVTHNSIQLQWSKAQYRKQSAKFYTVLFYEMKDPPDSEPQWKEFKTTNTKELTTVGDLAAQTLYCFKVRAEFQDMQLDSEVSDPIQTNLSPVIPGKPTAFNVTHNSLDLKWSKAQCKAQSIDFYTVLYRKINDSRGWVEKAKCTKESMKVTDLADKSIYYFQICAKFKDGTSLTSEVSNPILTNLESIQPGKPSASSVTHNSIRIQWSKAKHRAQNPKVYTIFYHEIKDPPTDSQPQWKKCTNSCIKESIIVSGLAAQTLYCFKVSIKFHDETVFSETSDPIQTDPPPVIPGKPTACNVTRNSLELKWSKAQCKAYSVDFYTVLYHKINDLQSSDHEIWTEFARSTSESIKVTGLADESSYYFKVHAKFNDGTSITSEISDPITGRPPVRPGKPKVSNKTHDSLELKWSEAQYGEQNAEVYTILYRESNAPQLPWKETKTAEAKKLITGLTAQTLYSFKVRAESTTGRSLVSDVSDPIKTYPEPMPPTKPTASSVTHNSIQLQWSKAQYRKQNVVYTVLFYEMKDPSDSEPQWKEFKTADNKESTTVGDLAAQTLYCFKVHAEFQDMQLVSQISDPIQTDPPPVNPGKPTASNVTHISLELTWTKAQYRACNADFYTVLYHQIKDSSYPEQWVKKGTSNEQFVKVTGLAGHSLYSFKVSAQFSDGTCLISDASDPIETDPYPVVPGKPTACNVTHNSIQLQWSKPQFGAQYVKFYTVFYQECNGPDHWIERKSKPGQDEFLTVTRLGAKKAYVFKVHPEIVSDPSFISKMSDQSDPIETEDRIALQMLTRKPTKEGPLSVYRMPFEEGMKDTKKKIRKYFVGAKTVPWVSKEKVLMVVGATGAGKSTLINGMVNYIMGVDWEDPFRFKLIADEGHSQSKSQTKWITAYTLPKMVGSTVPYTLTIIDTPGFGDTEGLKQDKFITTQIKEFFSKSPPDGIDHIDAIGFVTQSALARLTPTQQYIFNSILAIFGKDVANNIFMMVTFADGQYPPVMTAIKDAKLPCANFYKFNNSALFADNKVDESDEEEPENFDQMFWKMGFSSFKKFFNDFQKAESKSLQLTKEVLDERERLEITVNGLQPQIRNGLSKIEEMRQEEAALLKHEADIATNKEFTFEVDVPKQRQVSLKGLGIHVTNCLQCNFTCHETCGIAKDEDKHGCWAMTDGKCRICAKNCHWSKHVNNPYRYEQFTEKEMRTSADLKKKYDQAMSGKTQQQNMMAGIDAHLKAVHTEVLTNIKTVQQCLRKLDEIALNPNPLKEVEFLEILITSEQQAAQPGWKSRVQYLENAKEQAVMLQHIQVEDVVKQMEMEHDPQEEGTKSKSKSWYARFKGWVGIR